MLSMIISVLVLAYIFTLLLGASSSYGDLYDRLYGSSGSFPAVNRS
jgi:hypothetical protein